MSLLPSSLEFKENESLAKYTYYKIGGAARVFCSPQSREELMGWSHWIRSSKTEFRILGAGSNVLVPDQGFNGLVISTRKLNLPIQKMSNPERIRMGSGITVASFLARCCQNGWDGFQFLAGIPGSMGGVAVMNAGTYLGEAAGALYSVEGVDLSTGQVVAYSQDQMIYEYRKNNYLSKDLVIDQIEFKFLGESAPEKTKRLIDEVLKKRKDTQPVDQPSCGSVFKNPKSSGMHAWQVVEKLGLKGYQIGQAQISPKHGNFIVNLGGATAADVKALIELVKSRAQSELSISLEEEVKFF